MGLEVVRKPALENECHRDFPALSPPPPPGTKTDSSPLSQTIFPPGSPEVTTALWLCLWQAAVEPKPCLSGKHDRLPWRRCAGEA